MNLDKLNAVAEAMVADHKGLLAADESTGTIAKRLASINVEANEDSRRAYRELLFRTKGSGKYVSGAILYDETIRQKAKDGTPLVDLMKAEGIMPGIKVDMSTHPLPGSSTETITEGLDGLPGRVAEYVKLGATFAKWRAVITIGKGTPTQNAIDINAHLLARYAKICQEGGLVPIVEPEVLMDGDHSIDVCEDVTERTLHTTFMALYEQGVMFEGMILKPNMIIAAKDCPKQNSIDEVAARTVASLRRCVPPAVPGIMFLSGGQSEADATAHLNAMNKNFAAQPWKLSFSYGRALQQSALQAWVGKEENVPAAQQAYMERAKQNSLACAGKAPAEAA